MIAGDQCRKLNDFGYWYCHCFCGLPDGDSESMEATMRMKHKTSIPSGFKRQRCRVCKCQDKFNFYVPDRIWRQVVPHEYRDTVVCLPCFDEFARERNVDYSDVIEMLYFAGSQASFKFQTISAHAT
jgi:hypothetical protein